MNFAAYIPLAAAILNGLLTIFVLRGGLKAGTKIAYLVWGLSIAVWNIGTYQMFRVTTAEEALNSARFLQQGVIFLPIGLFHLCLHVCQIQKRKLVLLAYACGVALAASNSAGYFVKSVRPAGYAYYSEAGIGFWIYTVLYAVLTVSTLVVLWRAQKRAQRFQRGRIRSLLWATAILVAGGNNDILPILGIYEYPLLNIPIFPLGSFCAIFYGFLVGYSVLQHQLLDIHVALSRFAANAMRVGFLFLTGFLMLLVVAIFAPKGVITEFAFWAFCVILLASGMVAARLIPKLLGGTIDSLERRLLGDHFEYQDKIRSFIENCRWHTTLEGLFEELDRQLLTTINVSGYSIILMDETNRAFTLVRAHPPQAERQIANLETESPAFQMFTTRRLPYLPLGEHPIDPEDDLEKNARKQLEPFTGSLVFPFLVESRPIGLLVLGEKANGDPYTSTDLQLLIMVTENVSLVMNQISLKNRLLLNQELDLLGRMSQGMAHDLRNLITPVTTLLQLLTEGAPIEDLRGDLALTAMRNIQSMRDYIKEALFFSENARPQFAVARLDELVASVIEMAKQNNRKGKNIQYHTNTCGEILVEMDHVLIRRMITNLISNAVDASPKGEAISVEIIPLLKSEMKRDWFRIRITDHGSGIKPEDLERIFKPYFTTKNTGDEERGFGLGLAICRKIATLHGGSLAVSSQVGKGTTVNLDIPNRQQETLTGLGAHSTSGLKLLKAAS